MAHFYRVPEIGAVGRPQIPCSTQPARVGIYRGWLPPCWRCCWCSVGHLYRVCGTGAVGRPQIPNIDSPARLDSLC